MTRDIPELVAAPDHWSLDESAPVSGGTRTCAVARDRPPCRPNSVTGRCWPSCTECERAGLDRLRRVSWSGPQDNMAHPPSADALSSQDLTNPHNVSVKMNAAIYTEMVAGETTYPPGSKKRGRASKWS